MASAPASSDPIAPVGVITADFDSSPLLSEIGTGAQRQDVVPWTRVNSVAADGRAT
jgi:hypothetical protein